MPRPASQSRYVDLVAEYNAVNNPDLVPTVGWAPALFRNLHNAHAVPPRVTPASGPASSASALGADSARAACVSRLERPSHRSRQRSARHWQRSRSARATDGRRGTRVLQPSVGGPRYDRVMRNAIQQSVLWALVLGVPAAANAQGDVAAGAGISDRWSVEDHACTSGPPASMVIPPRTASARRSTRTTPSSRSTTSTSRLGTSLEARKGRWGMLYDAMYVEFSDAFERSPGSEVEVSGGFVETLGSMTGVERPAARALVRSALRGAQGNRRRRADPARHRAESPG